MVNTKHPFRSGISGYCDYIEDGDYCRAARHTPIHQIMKTFKQIREELNESSSFVEKTLIYYALKEGVIKTDSVDVERIHSLMFDALLGKQEAGELPGILNPYREKF
jgi:hypothetical protein